MLKALFWMVTGIVLVVVLAVKSGDPDPKVAQERAYRDAIARQDRLRAQETFRETSRDLSQAVRDLTHRR